MPLMSTVGSNIRRECETHGVSMQQLAVKSGVGIGRLYELEAVGGAPRLSEVLAIAEVLDIPYLTLVVSAHTTSATDSADAASIVTGAVRRAARTHRRRRSTR